jgi:hypothetical protein
MTADRNGLSGHEMGLIVSSGSTAQNVEDLKDRKIAFTSQTRRPSRASMTTALSASATGIAMWWQCSTPWSIPRSCTASAKRSPSDDGKGQASLHFQCEGMDCSRIRQRQAFISITYTECWAVLHEISQFALKDPPERRCSLDGRSRAGAARSAETL